MPIEKHSSEMDRIVSSGQEAQVLSSGFGGENGPAEGPLWWKEGSYLLFSDIHNNRRMKHVPGGDTTVFHEPTNRANGLTRDDKGRLVACEHEARRVTRMDPDGSITVVANNYHGRRLNRPNDVVVRSDGSIFFTDPATLGVESELDFFGVYKVSPDLGSMHLLVWDFFLPNGLAFSPDESVLYVNDSRRRHIRAFEVDAAGMFNLATERVFSDLSGERPGAPDGMKVDVEGNVYCGGSGGIWVIAPDGTHLGTVVHGAPTTTNMAWGGDDWKTLYFTTRDSLWSVQMNIPGVPVPVGNR